MTTTRAPRSSRLILGVPEWIWAKLTIQDRGYETPCLIWGGGCNDKDYGVVHVDGRQHYVHRFIYAAVKGPMPKKINGKRAVSDHLCRVHPCANPEHIEPVTDRVNVLRGVSFAAVNAAKTSCDSGHEFDLLNTKVDPGTGERICLECKRIAGRKSDAKKAAKRRANAKPKPPRAPKPKAPPRELAPCGTLAARLRHVRRGEPIDAACRAAHAEVMRNWRRAR